MRGRKLNLPMRAVVPYALVPMVGLIVAGCGGGVRYDPNAAPASGGAEPQGFTVPSCTPDASSQHLDTNGDGKHDAVSVRAGGAEVCRMSDSNGDGKLDTSEHYDHGRLVQRAIDTDGDGHADKWVSYPDPKDPTCTVTDVDKDRDGNHDAAQRTHTCTGSVVAAFTPKPLRFTYALPAATK